MWLSQQVLLMTFFVIDIIESILLAILMTYNDLLCGMAGEHDMTR